MRQAQLALHAHDLPPFWDDHAVEWRGWTRLTTTCRLPISACGACGSPEDQSLNFGYVAHDAATTHADFAVEDAKREVARQLGHSRPPVRTLNLTAFRCPDCHVDTIHQRDTDEWWILDDSDYGDNGSRCEGQS